MNDSPNTPVTGDDIAVDIVIVHGGLSLQLRDALAVTGYTPTDDNPDCTTYTRTPRAPSRRHHEGDRS